MCLSLCGGSLNSSRLEASAVSAQSARVTRARHSKQQRRRCACEAHVEQEKETEKKRRRRRRGVSIRAKLKSLFCRAEGARAVQSVSEVKCAKPRGESESTRRTIRVGQLARHDATPRLFRQLSQPRRRA